VNRNAARLQQQCGGGGSIVATEATRSCPGDSGNGAVRPNAADAVVLLVCEEQGFVGGVYNEAGWAGKLCCSRQPAVPAEPRSTGARNR